MTTDGNVCQFPFLFIGKEYKKCTKIGASNNTWCVVSKDIHGKPLEWGECDESKCSTNGIILNYRHLFNRKI